jgi:hypothetical protein
MTDICDEDRNKIAYENAMRVFGERLSVGME